MAYSLGLGMSYFIRSQLSLLIRRYLGTVNFLFALPAIKSIDTLGRRRWLILTLPVMAVFMAGGALSFVIANDDAKIGVLAFFLFGE